MTTKTNLLDSIATGTLISSGTASSGDQITITKGATSTITGTATAGEVIHGPKSMKLALVSGEGGYAYWDWTSVTAMSARAAYRFTARPGGTVDVLQILRIGSVKAACVRISSAGVVTVRDYNAANTLYTVPDAIPTDGGVYQFCLSVDPDTTTTGSCTFAVYDSGGNLALGMSSAYSATNVDVGDTATALRTANFGRITSDAWAFTYYLDSFESTDTYGLIDPLDETAGLLSVPSVTATGWTAVGAGTIQAALADTSDSTYALSGTDPSSSVVDLTLPGIDPPSAALNVLVRALKSTATTGTIVPTLRDGATVVSTGSTLTVPDAAGNLWASFPAADLTGVSTATWAAGTLVVRLTVSAS